MRRSYFFAIALLSLCILDTNLYAQKKNASSSTDANIIVTKTLSFLQSLKSLQADFTIQIEDSKGKIMATQKGSAQVKKNSYQLTLGDQEIYTDGSLMWVYNKVFNEVQLDTYKQKVGGSFDVESIFNGKLDIQKFNTKFNGSTAVKNAKWSEIELIPIDKASTFFKAVLWIEEKTGEIKKAKIFDKNGTRYLYITNRFVKNPSLPASFGKFEASKHLGVQVVDLR